MRLRESCLRATASVRSCLKLRSSLNSRAGLASPPFLHSSSCSTKARSSSRMPFSSSFCSSSVAGPWMCMLLILRRRDAAEARWSGSVLVRSTSFALRSSPRLTNATSLFETLALRTPLRASSARVAARNSRDSAAKVSTMPRCRILRTDTSSSIVSAFVLRFSRSGTTRISFCVFSSFKRSMYGSVVTSKLHKGGSRISFSEGYCESAQTSAP
mmetsp:Transcript_9002/g.20661  ORF Transcript_9002/g.20661 Transcript_9002/m.20661 type:complete len:214 (-) Transcript_9002:732-1373(-)